MSKFLGDNGGFQKLIELIKTALGLKVSLSNDLSFSAPAYSSANVGKYAVVLSVPINRRLTLSISSNANGYGSSNVVYLVGGQQNSSAYQLLGDGGFAIRHDIQAGKVYLCVPCLSSQYAPRKTYNAQVLFYSESDRTEIIVPQTQTIYDGDWINKAQTIYTAPLKDTQPFNVSSAGVGSIDLENYSSFLGKCPSEMDSVTIHVDNELAGQIYNLTFDHDVTDGITIDDGLSTPTVYCAISESVKAGDVITLTAASNTSNGWIYSHIGAPIESPDGSILVEISDGVTKLKVDPDKLTLPDDVLRNHSMAGDTYNDESLAIGHGSSVSSSSTSVGAYSTASGNESASFGYSASATGGHATAIGARTSANSGSTAVGDYSMATAYNAVAIGYNAKASGKDSIAIGDGVEAYSEGQIVLGRYNQVNAGDKLIFGCGTAVNARANLFGVNSLRRLYGLQGAQFEPVSIPDHGVVNGGMLSIAAGKIVRLDDSYATNGNMCWACAVGDCTFQGEELKAGEYRQYIGIGGTWYKMDNGGGGGSSFVESVGSLDFRSSTPSAETIKTTVKDNTVIQVITNSQTTFNLPTGQEFNGARRVFVHGKTGGASYTLQVNNAYAGQTGNFTLEPDVPYLLEFNSGWYVVGGVVLDEGLKYKLKAQTTIGGCSEWDYTSTVGGITVKSKFKQFDQIDSASQNVTVISRLAYLSLNFYDKLSGSGASFNELMTTSFFNTLSSYQNLDGQTVSRMIEWYCKPSVLKINDANIGAYYNSATKTLTISQPVRMVAFETTVTNYPEIEKIAGIEQDGYRLTIIPNGRCYLKESTGDYRFSSRLYQYVHDNGTSPSQSTHFDEAYIEVVQYNKVWLTKTY